MPGRAMPVRIKLLLAAMAVAFLIPFGMSLYVGQIAMGFGYLAVMVAGTTYAVRQITKDG